MIDFLKYRIASYAFSVFLIALLIGGVFYKYSKRGSVFLYGVEFTGGTQIIFDTSTEFSSVDMQAALEESLHSSIAIRQFSKTEHLVRIGSNDSINLLQEKISDSLASINPENKITIKQIESIGSGVGKELKPKAILAILCALLLMLTYVWIRFRSFAYAAANFISLAHDVLAILLFVLYFDYEISLDIITAILFILGYSINDTIVIFSKIRENLKKYASIETDYFSINLSINQTLRRTILTSAFTTLVVIPLLIFGGQSLQALSASLLLGIIFGTYSSIFIASPIVYDIKQKLN